MSTEPSAGSSAEAGAAPFDGFVTGGPATTLPSQFFVEVMPEIEDPAELRVTLYALYAIGRQRGALRALRGAELEAERPLLRTLASCGGAEAVRPALAAAVARGTLLDCTLDDGDTLYFVNNEGGQRARQRVRDGLLAVPGRGPGARPALPAVLVQAIAEPAHAARTYEQEIGILTPAVSEAITAAVERYPEQWVIDALRLAAERNARSWRYVEAVLRGWEADGRSESSGPGAGDDDAGGRGHGATGSTPGTAAGPNGDPYARIIHRSWPE